MAKIVCAKLRLKVLCADLLCAREEFPLKVSIRCPFFKDNVHLRHSLNITNTTRWLAFWDILPVKNRDGSMLSFVCERMKKTTKRSCNRRKGLCTKYFSQP